MRDLWEDYIWPVFCILMAFIIFIAALYGFIWLIDSSNHNNDQRCATAYGRDWKYYSGRGADCVNSQGEGKFLQ